MIDNKMMIFRYLPVMVDILPGRVLIVGMYNNLDQQHL